LAELGAERSFTNPGDWRSPLNDWWQRHGVDEAILMPLAFISVEESSPEGRGYRGKGTARSGSFPRSPGSSKEGVGGPPLL